MVTDSIALILHHWGVFVCVKRISWAADVRAWSADIPLGRASRPSLPVCECVRADATLQAIINYGEQGSD